MDFNLSSEQELLRDGLTKFLATRYDLTTSRAAAKTGPGWQPEIWRSFADELGILGAALPEAVGGMGGGPVEVMVIAEALGYALAVEPYINTAVVSAGLLVRAGGEAAETVLGQIAEGTAIVALADEPVSAVTAVRDGDDWVLDGSKIVVSDAPLATHLLVTAATEDGIALFLTEFDAQAPQAGLQVHGYRTIDDRRAADLTFDGLRLPGSTHLGPAADSLQLAHDEGAAAVCAEAVGGMRKVLADTVEYAKQRHQFGQPIGSFQVLQHRMVDMYMEVEQAASAVLLAVLNLEATPQIRAKTVSAAKATVGRAARFVGQNAVQLHGGMGMTEELAIGHYFKRLTAVQYEYGTTDAHVTRYAELTKN
ncbi:MAG TPA: acyl-CoA dehydrogenase family protein [Mycobacterium sp.]|nr:acyl-CoA dehydrogenase family protein [Mycobacterium sp.]